MGHAARGAGPVPVLLRAAMNRLRRITEAAGSPGSAVLPMCAGRRGATIGMWARGRPGVRLDEPPGAGKGRDKDNGDAGDVDDLEVARDGRPDAVGGQPE